VAFRANRWRRRSHVYNRGPADIRDDHQLYAVLSGGARVLTSRKQRKMSYVLLASLDGLISSIPQRCSYNQWAEGNALRRQMVCYWEGIAGSLHGWNTFVRLVVLGVLRVLNIYNSRITSYVSYPCLEADICNPSATKFLPKTPGPSGNHTTHITNYDLTPVSRTRLANMSRVQYSMLSQNNESLRSANVL
jgi:hypothetical protein